MTKEGIFLVFCLEIYRYAKGMSGSEVMALFEKYRIDDYVVTYYEALRQEKNTQFKILIYTSLQGSDMGF